MKFGIYYYVVEICPHATFGKIGSVGASGGMGEI